MTDVQGISKLWYRITVATLAALALLGLEQLAPAAVFNIDGRAVELNPVSGSSWSQESGNQGKIPYEKCMIADVNHEGKPKDVFDVLNLSSVGTSFLFYGETQFNPDQSRISFYKMLCYSERLHLATLIPVFLGKMKTSGLSLEPFVHANLIETIRVKDLDGKPLGEFFGTFSGSDFAFGAGVGGGIQALSNQHGIRLTNSQGGAKIGLVAGYATLKVSPGAVISAQSYLVTRQYFPDPNVSWIEIAVPSRSGLQTELALQLDFTGMDQYRFVKIR